MDHEFTDADLEAYLDEALNSETAAELEQALKKDDELLTRLSYINGRRDAGVHTLGEIWRRHQIGVPTSEEMGNFLLGVLPKERADYINFRIKVLRCRYTIAMMNDLENRQSSAGKSETNHRRKKYFDSSAGLLRRSKGK